MITAWIGGLIFLFVAILYILLALGLPYGELAMGGKFKIMPNRMRFICIISVFVQIFAILVVLQAGNILNIALLHSISKGACFFFAIYITLNALMNFVSKSKKEKYFMTPLSLIAAICFFITAINE